MAQANTNSPKVRRMLCYVSPIISVYILPFSTLLHGHIALAIPSLLETDPQILEHWITLMRITWANHSKRWILISNVSMTYDGFCEFNTSDWFSVCLSSSAKSIKTSAAPYPEIRNPTVVYSSTWPLHFCHHSF